MRIIGSEKKLCECCMKIHDVLTVITEEKNEFKGTEVIYEAGHYYCDLADEMFDDEKMISANDIEMKNAYRRQKGLLTTEEISNIRSGYAITQSDFCLLLGWGAKTITRYEGHQVQDNAHDSILRKIGEDPEWFLSLLYTSRKLFPENAFSKYEKAGIHRFEKYYDAYLKRAIRSQYVRYADHPEWNGCRSLSIDTVIDVANYFANHQSVTDLYKVKIMKLFWYADALSYSNRGHAITGMVYKAVPTGAAPVAQDHFLELSGIPCEETESGDGTVFRLLSNENRSYPHLTADDRNILDTIINRFGSSSRQEVFEAMRKEAAYRETGAERIIPFTRVPLSGLA